MSCGRFSSNCKDVSHIVSAMVAIHKRQYNSQSAYSNAIVFIEQNTTCSSVLRPSVNAILVTAARLFLSPPCNDGDR